MPKSLHLIHRDRKARGDPPKKKKPRTLSEARAMVRLPFEPSHITKAELEEAIHKLP